MLYWLIKNKLISPPSVVLMQVPWVDLVHGIQSVTFPINFIEHFNSHFLALCLNLWSVTRAHWDIVIVHCFHFVLVDGQDSPFCPESFLSNFYKHIHILRRPGYRLATGWTTKGLDFESQQKQDLLLLHVVQTGSGAHPASYPWVLGNISPGCVAGHSS
jgi:hypothetical protein